jgi:transcriptional regulator with XRE-family HTH domain
MSPVNVSTIGSYIREQREQAKISLRQLAQAAGVSNPYLSQIERGLRKPSADILQQIAKGLRISAEALYVQAGLLEDRPDGSAVRDAVLTDPDLTERQKQMLIEIYESFRKETTTVQASEQEDDDATDADIDQSALAWPEALEPVALARWAIGAGPDSAADTPAPESATLPEPPAAAAAAPEHAAEPPAPAPDQAGNPRAEAGQGDTGEEDTGPEAGTSAHGEGATIHAFPSTSGNR